MRECLKAVFKGSIPPVVNALEHHHHNISDILEQIKREAQYMEKYSANYNALDRVEAAAVLDEERDDRD